ncbi:hypothetical protein B484DRAFT_404206 [Ochromonadaceae sp. CCMP2298]|nr:hypothetical protein B484DRAFT_404206 [Ochromonadaceae sp. CCMP2298]
MRTTGGEMWAQCAVASYTLDFISADPHGVMILSAPHIHVAKTKEGVHSEELHTKCVRDAANNEVFHSKGKLTQLLKTTQLFRAFTTGDTREQMLAHIVPLPFDTVERKPAHMSPMEWAAAFKRNFMGLIYSYKDVSLLTRWEFHRRSAPAYQKALNKGGGTQDVDPTADPKGNGKGKGGKHAKQTLQPNQQRGAPVRRGISANNLMVHYKITQKTGKGPTACNFGPDQTKAAVLDAASKHCNQYLLADTMAKLRKAISADQKYP